MISIRAIRWYGFIYLLPGLMRPQGEFRCFNPGNGIFPSFNVYVRVLSCTKYIG